MSPPKPTHPLAHLPDPPQNYIPCVPTKYWPSTMDEEQHSSQGNKWWWLVYLGPMQGAYATRATAVANVPSASKIENTIEYFDTLTDLNCGWKKSYFHWHSHCPVHFACASVSPGTLCVLLNALQRGSQTIAPAALAVFRMLGTLHRRPRTTLLAALATFRMLGLLRAFPEAGAKVEEYLVGPHRQIRLHASIHHRHSHSAILRRAQYPSTLTAHPQDPPPPLPLLLLIPHPPGPFPLQSQLDKVLYPCTHTRPLAGILPFGRTRPAILPDFRQPVDPVAARNGFLRNEGLLSVSRLSVCPYDSNFQF
ncbi:hypothetical protein B0H13DRAFT_2389906 [Mycena leptocephala]|nr:hypothetical protein B0H13DRAFT_2389906 [Mycena leptocephala]